MRKNTTLALLAAAWLAGCGKGDSRPAEFTTPSPAAAPEATCVYAGENGLSFTVAFRADTAWVFLPEGTRPLPHVVSASGAKYSDGQVMLWTKGNDAILSRHGLPDVTVRNNPQLAVWEHAKLSGVDFRATGNEPGWVLELWGDGRVVYRGDHGETLLEFPRPEPEIDRQAATTTYRCRNGQHELVVVLRPGPCQDSMADQEYETTVTLNVDGRSLSGCGRPLH